ncbi:DddA-like double-stranded DNA deaminase toxin [Amycolatopsis thailandensis]|uniref:DddA-like double-stranded DNA deaminase toxin n=1 Tax=Amycolatopsis thailandensis TaxID=589330 RepID=UPI0036317FBE
MENVAGVVAGTSAATDSVDTAAAHLQSAANLIEEALTALAPALQDANNGHAALSDAHSRISDLTSKLREASEALARYTASLRGADSAPAEPGTQQPASAPRHDDATSHEPPQVAAARASLPPPVQPNTGQKTHGRWFATGSRDPGRPIVSGTGGPDPDDPDDVTHQQAQEHLTALGYRKLAIAAHVETKLAVRMARTGLDDVTVTINHVPCPGPLGCDKVLPSVLPAGSTLTVYGVTADGTPKTYRYQGKAR